MGTLWALDVVSCPVHRFLRGRRGGRVGRGSGGVGSETTGEPGDIWDGGHRSGQLCFCGVAR